MKFLLLLETELIQMFTQELIRFFKIDIKEKPSQSRRLFIYKKLVTSFFK